MIVGLVLYPVISMRREKKKTRIFSYVLIRAEIDLYSIEQKEMWMSSSGNFWRKKRTADRLNIRWSISNPSSEISLNIDLLARRYSLCTVIWRTLYTFLVNSLMFVLLLMKKASMPANHVFGRHIHIINHTKSEEITDTKQKDPEKNKNNQLERK